MENIQGEVAGLIHRSLSSNSIGLSLQQEWCWGFMEKYPHWNFLEAYALRVKGDLSIPVLRRSLLELLRRHDGLRTRIQRGDEGPVQLIDDEPQVDLQQIECSGEVLLDRERLARSRIEDFLQQPVDLATDPPLRVRWIQLGQSDFVVAFAIHHIFIDWASEVVLFRELWSLYADFAHNRTSHLVAPQRRWADYVSFQRTSDIKWRTDHERYWEEKLSNVKPVQFPDYPIIYENRPQTAVLPFELDESLTAAVHQLARHQRKTVPMVVLAAYVANVSRLSGQQDLVLPFLVTGRVRRCDEEAIGFFAHNVHLRFRLTGRDSLLQLLQLATREFLTSLHHMDDARVSIRYPELLTGVSLSVIPWEDSEANGIHTPTLWNESAACPSIESFPFQLAVPADDDALSAFSMEIRTAKPRMSGKLWYRSSQFSAETMKKFIADLGMLMHAFVRDPHATLATLEVGPQADSASALI